nr:hypothetical protein CFP56_00176 [Quercus suber]
MHEAAVVRNKAQQRWPVHRARARIWPGRAFPRAQATQIPESKRYMPSSGQGVGPLEDEYGGDCALRASPSMRQAYAMERVDPWVIAWPEFLYDLCTAPGYACPKSGYDVNAVSSRKYHYIVVREIRKKRHVRIKTPISPWVLCTLKPSMIEQKLESRMRNASVNVEQQTCWAGAEAVCIYTTQQHHFRHATRSDWRRSRSEDRLKRSSFHALKTAQQATKLASGTVEVCWNHGMLGVIQSSLGTLCYRRSKPPSWGSRGLVV